jgi:hypothetical protein
MSRNPVPVEADGYRHPASEDELRVLVKMAYDENRQLRVRGAAHTPSHGIYTDPLHHTPNRVNWPTPPPGDGVNVMLDRYCDCRVRNKSKRLVEADAGIRLGRDSPHPDPTYDHGLLKRIWEEEGWTLSDVGGITLQTVSGFTATGSAGGSVRHSLNDSLWGFRVIDAQGKVHEVSIKDPKFYAMAPNLGLLGVVSKVIFQCKETYNISGQESITTIKDCAIDLFGAGTSKKPSLEQFLRDAEYARLEWWPQRGAERIVVWQAQRIDPEPEFRPRRYQEFTAHPKTAELAMSFLLTLFGNLDWLPGARSQFQRIGARAFGLLPLASVARKLGRGNECVEKILDEMAGTGIGAALLALQVIAPAIKCATPCIFPPLLNFFMPLDSSKDGDEEGEPQSFRDYAWHGLPMDDEEDDELLPTAFTEMWVPLPRTKEVMQLFKSYFEAPASKREAYGRTGLDPWELYAAKPTSFWLSPSYTDGSDEWKDGAFRINVYWFAANRGDPVGSFYPQFWDLLRTSGIPFRLHWGKYQPVCNRDDPAWVDFFKAQYPRWNAFLNLRAKRDPTGIFLTSYWRDHLGL